MDYEEKLRLAKEALKSGSYDRKTIEYIFPELKESEEEKIRKEIISALQYANHKGVYDKHLVWLEKQGESKFEQCVQDGDKIVTNNDGSHFNVSQLERVAKKEHKFRNGQWIVWQDKCYKVNYNGCGYELVDQNGLSTSLEYGTVEESAYLWDITKDAKDGDVLITKKGNSFIYDKNRYNNGLAYYYAGLNVNRELTIKSPHHMLSHFGSLYDVIPATKEQRDTLERAMTNAGYRWNKEELKLEKI